MPYFYQESRCIWDRKLWESLSGTNVNWENTHPWKHQARIWLLWVNFTSQNTIAPAMSLPSGKKIVIFLLWVRWDISCQRCPYLICRDRPLVVKNVRRQIWQKFVKFCPKIRCRLKIVENWGLKSRGRKTSAYQLSSDINFIVAKPDA